MDVNNGDRKVNRAEARNGDGTTGTKNDSPLDPSKTEEALNVEAAVAQAEENKSPSHPSASDKIPSSATPEATLSPVDATSNLKGEHQSGSSSHAPHYSTTGGGGGGGYCSPPPDTEAFDEENSDEDDSDDSSSDMSAQDDDSTWISWFCSLRGNEFFCEIDEDYIRDEFNLTGLSSQVYYYDYALDLILDMESPNEENFTEEQQETIESAAEILYGLAHSRYILTNRGMQQMLAKYQNAHFGKCHRVLCHGQPVLPMGQSDISCTSTVCVYCPKCRDIYYPKSRRQGNIDGAYFGTTFPHLFLLQHPELIPQHSSKAYTPRIYGFRINKDSVYYNRNHREGSSSSRRRQKKKNERQQLQKR